MIDAVRRRFAHLIASTDSWVSDMVPGRPGIRAVMIALGLSVAAIGVLDYVTGPLLSLVLLYLVPTAIGTIAAGRSGGLALALSSALAQTAAGVIADKPSEDVQIVINGMVLLVTLGIMVMLLAAVRESDLASRRSAQQGQEFLAYAAHQLRTPLAGMRASTDALLLGGASSRQERLLSNLSREADRAGRLLAALLQMARLDQGEIAPVQPQNLVELCRSELERLEARARTLKLELRLPDVPPGPVMLSAEATRDALANLLDNARRHAASTVVLALSYTPSTLEISVADDGPGLPEGARERVFERFVSLDGEGGTGLGLPIARGLIESQGGRLTYENGRFVIRLPQRRPAS